jgi:hypothetical protein
MGAIAREFTVRGCERAIAAIEAELTDLASALTEAQFQAPPRTGGWSVGHCIEHLVLTGNEFVAKWDAALKRARANGSPDNTSFRYPWWQRAVLKATEPPYRLKTKTAQSFLPCSRRSMQETIHGFLSMHQEFAKRLEISQGVNTDTTKVQSPFASWVWYPLGFSFDFALAHERRHLWQAWQVREQLIKQF